MGTAGLTEEVSRHLYMGVVASIWPLSYLVGPIPFKDSVARGCGHELSAGSSWGVVWHQVPWPSLAFLSGLLIVAR